MKIVLVRIRKHTLLSYCFFFNDTATTEIYTLSLHDALPILILQANHERQALESKVQTLERQKVEQDDLLHRDQLRYEQQLREHGHSKTDLEKELTTLR